MGSVMEGVDRRGSRKSVPSSGLLGTLGNEGTEVARTLDRARHEPAQTTIYTRSYMNGDSRTPVDRDILLETLAAELTLAAYRVALRTRTQGTWLDLELDLWRALADTARTWGAGIASAPMAVDAACTTQRR
jgi:hypothetical protein